MFFESQNLNMQIFIWRMADFHKLRFPIKNPAFYVWLHSDHHLCFPKIEYCCPGQNESYFTFVSLSRWWLAGDPPVSPPPSRPPPMLILGTYIFAKGRLAFCTAAAVPGSHKNTVHQSCTGNQGPPLALYSSFLGQQGLQATFLLFQNFERVQQTSSHLVGLANLKMLDAGQNVW